jgi:hypothetical protein
MVSFGTLGCEHPGTFEFIHSHSDVGNIEIPLGKTSAAARSSGWMRARHFAVLWPLPAIAGHIISPLLATPMPAPHSMPVNFPLNDYSLRGPDTENSWRFGRMYYRAVRQWSWKINVVPTLLIQNRVAAPGCRNLECVGPYCNLKR